MLGKRINGGEVSKGTEGGIEIDWKGTGKALSCLSGKTATITYKQTQFQNNTVAYLV